jgi:hypothetical protein
MLIRRAQVKKFSFSQFMENETTKQDIAKSIYFFGIDYYNMLKDNEN